MLTTLFSFLGGTAFRMIWGEVSAWLTKRQDHQYELERMQLQEQLDDKAHARSLENMRLQAELGIKVIEAETLAAVSKTEADAWATLVEGTTRKIGIKWIDAWNGSIRPFLATAAMGMVGMEFIALNFVMNDMARSLVAAILGIYVADRSLLKRGK